MGGDWFDVIELASGGTAFVIGDVVGHGVQAATVMGQVRTAIRSYALLELPPAEVLTHVSRLTADLAELAFVTCFYAVWAPDDTLTFASAGHPPAILIGADGSVALLGEAMAAPLGVGREYPQQVTQFVPGAQLTLYTDGLVESRSRDLAKGTAWLVEALTDLRGSADPGPACDRLIETMTPEGHDDDIALVHVRHRDDGAEATDGAVLFRERVAATARAVIDVRRRLDGWLSQLRLDPVRHDDILLAANEAMANAAEHAYRGLPPGQFVLDARHRHGQLRMIVTDFGRWKLPDDADPYRGRGLPLIEAVTDEVAVHRREDGTTVTMAWKT